MLQGLLKLAKFFILPTLMTGGLLTRVGGEYEEKLTVAICVCAALTAVHAIWKRDLFLAAAFTAIGIMASPILLVAKLFVLMTLAVLVTILTLVIAFRPGIPALENDIPA